MHTKNPAAVALAKAKSLKYTAEERSAIAKHAVNARWAKARGEQPVRWWGFFSVEDPDHPQARFWSQEKADVGAWARRHPKAYGFIDFIEGFNPRAIQVTMEFKPNREAQLKALKIAAGREEK